MRIYLTRLYLTSDFKASIPKTERITLRSTMTPQTEHMQILVASSCYCFASVGMLLFNKFAVQDFPLECCLVWAQLFFAATCLSLFAFPYIHVGSAKDLLRWCMVVPFYCGMLLTSILALKTAPMSLVIVLRNSSPLGTLLIERFYPEPLRISGFMLGSIFLMIAGAVMYVTQLPSENWQGIGWVFLNSVIAVVDRLLQRLLLSKEQCPVDISKTGITLINNLVGMLPVGLAAYAKGEIEKLPLVYGTLNHWDKFYIAMTCVIGLTISYTSIWAQSLISATSFLVMINANKFVIIGIEAYGLHSKALNWVQILGASLTVLGGILYGKARQWIEREAERQTLLPKALGK